MNEMLTKSIGTAIRTYRRTCTPKMSLDDLADLIVREGAATRPSTAKLSRIETGKQPVATDILDPLERITGIPAKEMRPDLAKLFEVGPV